MVRCGLDPMQNQRLGRFLHNVMAAGQPTVLTGGIPGKPTMSLEMQREARWAAFAARQALHQLEAAKAAAAEKAAQEAEHGKGKRINWAKLRKELGALALSMLGMAAFAAWQDPSQVWDEVKEIEHAIEDEVHQIEEGVKSSVHKIEDRVLRGGKGGPGRA